jgi:hypothetical protein
MPIPALKSLSSPDIDPPALPAEPTRCAVFVEAEIGPLGEDTGADLFSFTVATPSALLDGADVRWGRGYLIVERFSWEAVERAIGKLLMHADRATWAESAAELAKELHWEFEHYTP